MFFKKSKTAKLEKQYKKLLEEAYQLSTVDRAASDLKMAEAEEVAKQIEAVQAEAK
jgi:hypothetical protein